jgi:hypothetical protein
LLVFLLLHISLDFGLNPSCSVQLVGSFIGQAGQDLSAVQSSELLETCDIPIIGTTTVNKENEHVE